MSNENQVTMQEAVSDVVETGKPTFYREDLGGAECFYVKHQAAEGEPECVTLVGMSFFWNSCMDFRFNYFQDHYAKLPKKERAKKELEMAHPFTIRFGIDEPSPFAHAPDAHIKADLRFDAKGKCLYAHTEWAGAILLRRLFNSREVDGCQHIISGLLVNWLEKEFGDNAGLGRKMILKRVRKFYKAINATPEFTEYNIDLFKRELEAMNHN